MITVTRRQKKSAIGSVDQLFLQNLFGHTWGTHTWSLLLRMRAGLSPSVGSNVFGSLSIPFIDRSTGSGLPVADNDDVGATAEKAAALLMNEAKIMAALNFIVWFFFCRIEMICVSYSDI